MFDIPRHKNYMGSDLRMLMASSDESIKKKFPNNPAEQSCTNHRVFK